MQRFLTDVHDITYIDRVHTTLTRLERNGNELHALALFRIDHGQQYIRKVEPLRDQNDVVAKRARIHQTERCIGIRN